MTNEEFFSLKRGDIIEHELEFRPLRVLHNPESYSDGNFFYVNCEEIAGGKECTVDIWDCEKFEIIEKSDEH